MIGLVHRADTIWSELGPLMDQKIASAYDQAAAQLQELRDAYPQAGDSGGFQHCVFSSDSEIRVVWNEPR